MPENWTYQYLNVLVHQGRKHKVTIDGVTGVQAIYWLNEQGIKYEITFDPEVEKSSFYFEDEQTAFLFKLRWLGA